MGNEHGEWIMHGVDWDSGECLHSPEETIAYINEVGFLPLFAGDIPGFSIEEKTDPAYWWSGDIDRDPWAWREIITRSGEVAYGKFFGKKAGFISKEWLPYFANYRREGYDFDALWEDQKANRRQKKIMDEFLVGDELSKSNGPIYSNELKKKAGFGKGGEKNYDGILTSLQMMLYLVPCDFRRRLNKQGEEYGWPVALYDTPESIWGAELVRSGYSKTPKESLNRIVEHLCELYPDAEERNIRKLLR